MHVHEADQESSFSAFAFRAVKVFVVVLAFVGVGKFSSGVVRCVAKLLLCSWRPLCVLSVALEAGAHWRGSRAADAAIKGSEEGFDRVIEDRCALPVSWRFAAS